MPPPSLSHFPPVRLSVFSFEQSYFPAQGYHSPHHFLLHETEAHCYDRHPEDDVERHEDELEVDQPAEELVLGHHLVVVHLDWVPRHQVTEPDGG